MLMNLKEILQLAEEKKMAIGSFNVYNVESVQAVMAAARNTQSPAIVSFGESYDKHMPLEAMASMFSYYAAHCELPLVLHLDHSKKLETIFRALKAGFTSIMYDGSALPLAENIEQSRYVADIAHGMGASVEGELGYMNPEDGTPAATGEQGSFTSVADARQYSRTSGADALAIAIGNAHGIYKGEPKLDFGQLDSINKAVDIPLVLHGSSGIPDELLRKAIELGIRKININTEVSTTGIKASREFLGANTDANTRFEAMTKAAEKQMTAVVEQYMDLFKRG
ncbi:Fructose-bisphosphate aldolase class II [Anaerovibrio sp. JC8]|uniref:class II fructose-bisphosphate aldolase n=1 Tax=Anaerovibrio sp. JC8 TaxID=1240085 RepID=UPI000A0D6F92|nr:class II fructose-bisphosphate aldolase [Anaerovibrio sp. JC8]ORU00759.1 Fructose-bisphosphate aldolase class II [Anaerovibrio sp. JC8]